MRQTLLLIICLSLALGASAQNQQPVRPLYFVGGKTLTTTAIDSFNRLIESKVPEYHLIAMDSSDLKEWSFSYRNNEHEKLTISYIIKVTGGNRDLKIPYQYGISDIKIDGQFLTMAKLYNGIFSKNLTPQDIQAAGSLSGNVAYEGSGKFFFIFSKDYGWGHMFFRDMQ